MTRSGTVAGMVLTFFLLVGCGVESGPGEESPPGDRGAVTDLPGDRGAVTDLDDEVAGVAMLLQASADEPVQACVAGVMESYPPKCDGVPIRGDFSWTGLESESANGVTWTQQSHYVVGHLDPTGGPLGSLTLTGTPTLEPPEGYPDSSTQDLDRACQVVGDEAGGRWHGDDCAAQDLPEADDMWAAMRAVGDDDRLTRVLGVSTAGEVLQVRVVVADRTTVTRIHEAVAPWLPTEQVVVDAALTPLEPGE